MNLISQIESILFVASKPLSFKDLIKATGVKEEEIKIALEELKLKYNNSGSGINILFLEDKVQMATNSENQAVVDLFVKIEASGELTKAQLETLTVIAYRGPITRPELEQVRGVNCALILRNLLLRGLIEENDAENKILPTFCLSFEALKHLGVNTPANLPNYNDLHTHEFVERILGNGNLNSDQAE
ncbi:MAG: Segregation and condensation protein B [Candidatus Magasanikbacteria bacterium GW2011_GWC2_37_14]|uniref:Segregation and condensation protein B n=1 Tax=Candidatus Magasanikbacteria bacterium GW2011_GWC2_37_14 TaxID=1619046 RepID=A0A0G0G7S8_9BACT|nr:MAG: Segregation and condensation protein B [Candidatus Magasanikbacteria bacterium GW2011_GWC2_37_14]